MGGGSIYKRLLLSQYKKDSTFARFFRDTDLLKEEKGKIHLSFMFLYLFKSLI